MLDNKVDEIIKDMTPMVYIDGFTSRDKISGLIKLYLGKATRRINVFYLVACLFLLNR